MQIDNVQYDRQQIANHANNLANTIQGNLKRSLEALGVVRAPARPPAQLASGGGVL